MELNLHKAKKNKNDEYYTQYKDIEKQVSLLKDQFKDKVIFMPCDNKDSQFWIYFHKNFKKLQLKEIVAISNNVEKDNFITYNGNGDDNNISDYINYTMLDDGDFRNYKVRIILSNLLYKYGKENIIICTNPPFSLMLDWISFLEECRTKFLFIGGVIIQTNPSNGHFFINNKVNIGLPVIDFLTPEGQYKKLTCQWYTNLEVKKELLQPSFTYDKSFYKTIIERSGNKKYLESKGLWPLKDVIKINKISEIPKDYTGIMAVPFTIMKYDLSNYEILGFSSHLKVQDKEINIDLKKQHITQGFIVKSGFFIVDRKSVGNGFYIKGRTQGRLVMGSGTIILDKSVGNSIFIRLKRGSN